MPLMPELITCGLFGRGLIPVHDQMLVARYNAALADMGLTQTLLSSFQIDKMGWSPEIAAEQDNDYYLSHGDANPLAIILTPEQLSPKVPIYFPFHSYDWEMMAAWGNAHRSQVFEITKDSVVWLDIDQDADLYQTPADLGSVYEVIIRARSPDGLIARALEQNTLVADFIRGEDSHLDAGLIEKIRVSRETSGDLRKRSLVVRDYSYTDVRNFYSRAFGGVFVLRSRGNTTLMFCRNPRIARKHGIDIAGMNALEPLLKHGYVEQDIGWWQGNLYRLRIIAESYLMDVLDKEEPELEFLSLNSAERKATVQKYSDQLGMYLELRRLVRELENGNTAVRVSEDVAKLLHHPAHDLSPLSREVVGQLLTYMYGGRLVPLFYRHQKTEFAKAYSRVWKKPRRQWAQQRIREHYDLASKSSSTSS